MKMPHIEIPSQLNRNDPQVQASGVEKTGLSLINYANELLGHTDLSGTDILDIGCGSRFTQTIINLDISIKSYTGVDIDRPLIEYLINNVNDTRFSFHYWNIFNKLYNPAGKKLTRRTNLPITKDKKYDAIYMFSVITHNYPKDTECLFHILRKYIKKSGHMLFSAFIDSNIDAFEERQHTLPLVHAYYNERFISQIISKTGWEIKSAHNKKPDKYIQHHFVCSPKKKSFFWGAF